MKKILFITDIGSPLGGNEELWSKTAIKLSYQGYQVRALTNHFGKPVHSKIENLIANGVNVHFRKNKLRDNIRKIGEKLNRVKEFQFYKTNSENTINKYPKNIRHYTRLLNKEVLELLINSHVGLLPTWSDFFGYSVLDTQASDCPVITTNIRVLPEINNNNNIGWVLEVPIKEDKQADIMTQDKREVFSKILESDLKRVVLSIINSPESIEIKGKLSLEEIKQRCQN